MKKIQIPIIMKKLTCDNCCKHLCTVDEMWVINRKIKELNIKCLSCEHITKFYLPELLRIIDDAHNYKLIKRNEV